MAVSLDCNNCFIRQFSQWSGFNSTVFGKYSSLVGTFVILVKDLLFVLVAKQRECEKLL